MIVINNSVWIHLIYHNKATVSLWVFIYTLSTEVGCSMGFMGSIGVVEVKGGAQLKYTYKNRHFISVICALINFLLLQRMCIKSEMSPQLATKCRKTNWLSEVWCRLLFHLFVWKEVASLRRMSVFVDVCIIRAALKGSN